MLSILPQLPHVFKACIPPPSLHPFVGPHTESLSWHRSHACCQMSSPCASAGPTQRCLYLHPVWAHLPGYPWRLVKMWGCILASSYCSRKASTLKCQNVYVTSTPRSVDLKISISSLTGASCFLSLLPLQSLCLCWWPTVSLTVEYPSESGTPLSGEERGEPPPPTVVHWVLGGLPQGHAVPAWATGLTSVLSPTPGILPFC